MFLPKTKFIMASLTALIICMSAFFLPVYASTGDDGGGDEYESDYVPIVAISGEFEEPVAINESMLVNAAWLDAEMLRIDVTDLITGMVSSLAIRLGDFIADAGNSPYILIQAADLDGNLSGIIRIANPFYSSAEDTDEPQNGAGVTAGDMVYGENVNPPFSGLTPDGTGTVVDNIVTQNDIEFFTVFTEEGNVFYLVVDRKSSNENVHLLNAVTEADLMALAERSGNYIDSSVSAIPPIEDLLPSDDENQPPDTTPESEEPETTARRNNSNLIIIGIAALAFGAAAYYFKIVRPKQNAVYEDDDYGEPDNDDTEEDYGGDILNEDYDDGSDEK